MDSKQTSQTVRDFGPQGRYEFSVIIPVLDEQQQINLVIEHLRKLPGSEAAEIVVVDGDSQAGTIKSIADKGVTVFTCGKGRGRQMNAGAAAAKGEMLILTLASSRTGSSSAISPPAHVCVRV